MAKENLTCEKCGAILSRLESEPDTYICLHCGNKQLIQAEQKIINNYNVTQNFNYQLNQTSGKPYNQKQYRNYKIASWIFFGIFILTSIIFIIQATTLTKLSPNDEKNQLQQIAKVFLSLSLMVMSIVISRLLSHKVQNGFWHRIMVFIYSILIVIASIYLFGSIVMYFVNQ